MDDSNHPDTCSAGRLDLAWGRLARASGSGSFIEDQLSDLVGGAPSPGKVRVDVVQIDPEDRL
ncbi:hypothetical protein ACVW00_000030 [Marmoricola sp. URHA0025 HA25]